MDSLLGVTHGLATSIRATSAQEKQWLASAPPEMQGQMMAQLELQKQQELMQMVVQLMKAMDEASKTIRNNIGG